LKTLLLLATIAGAGGCSATVKSAVKPKEEPIAVAPIATETSTASPGRLLDKQAHDHPLIQATREELEAIIDQMQTEADAFDGKNAETFALVRKMLAGANSAELKRFLDAKEPFPFSEERHQIYWHMAVGFAFIFMQIEECEKREAFLVATLPNFLRVMPPAEQFLSRAAGRMLLTRMQDVYECKPASI
jgi:hypothetical protein